MEGDLDEVEQGSRRVRCMVDVADAVLPAPVAHWRREGRVLTGYSPDDADTLSRKLAGSGVSVLESESATLEIFFEHMWKP